MDLPLIIRILDLCGVAVFAVSGALAAGRKRMDVFGVVVLALVTALGGGTLRDTLLDSGTVFWIADRSYLLVAGLTAILTFVAIRSLTFPVRALLIFDALGLAVFTVVGTARTLQATGSGSVAVVMGVMTGVAGGMLRDVLSAEVPLILRKEIYATAAICGSAIYVIMRHFGVSPPMLLVVSLITTLSIRLAAIRWGLSLPVLNLKEMGKRCLSALP